MILTNNEILDNYIRLKEFKEKEVSLPVKLSYALSRNQKLLEGYVVDIEKVRIELIQKYGNVTSDGEYKIDKENIEHFSKELKELLDIENDLPLSTITEKELLNMNVNLSTKDIDSILFFVVSETSITD